MKMKLKKMLLMNWLYYEKAVLTFEDIVFLSGKTGEGKSALIDAMQIVILGDTRNSIFNKSANEKSSRDLIGYIKGKHKNGTYKRDQGSFSTHLCMEFEDEKGNIYSYGIVFDCDGTTRMDLEYRFYMMSQAIPDHCFINEGKLYDIREMKKYLDSLKDQGITSKLFGTNKDYRIDFKIRMNIKDERFFDVFKMAVAYTPMMNVSEFIVKNICNEDEELDLEEMQEEIRDYRQMKEKLQEVQEKKELLVKIHQVYEETKQQEQQYKELQLNKEAYSYQAKVLELQHAQIIRQQNNEESKQLQEQEKQYNQQIEDINQQIEHLKELKKDNAAEILEQKIQELKKEEQLHQSVIKGVQEQLLKKGEYLKDQVEQLEDIEQLDFDAYALSTRKLEIQKSLTSLYDLHNFPLMEYTKLQESLHNLSTYITEAKIHSQNSIKNLRNELAQLTETQKQLEKGKKNYPQTLLELKSVLEEKLSARYGKQIPVFILADLIHIEDMEWTDAIEGYIHNQKLNLVVDEAYFMDAFHIYRSLPKDQIHTYSIIDYANVKAKRMENVKTLYDCVSVEKEELRSYVMYLLGRVVCCEEEETIRNYPISITKDCMLYSGYAVSRMNPRLYRIPFIGKDSLEKQLAEIHSNRINKQEELQEIEKLYQELFKIQVDGVITDDFIRQIHEGMKKASIVKDCQQQILMMKKQQNPESLQELLQIDEDLKKARTMFESFDKKRVKVMAKLENLQTDIQSCDESITRLEQELEEMPMPKQGFPNEILQIEELSILLNLQRINEEKMREIVQKIEIKKGQLLLQKQNYNEVYRISLNPHYQANDFEREYVRFSNAVEEEYIEKSRIAELKAYERFQNDFFNIINDKIQNVRNQIDRLNRSIRKHQFGRSKYEFVCVANEDYREYYDLITSDELKGRNLLTTKVYEEHEELIRGLFNKIAQLSSIHDPKLYQEVEKEVKRLSRFTTYLKFDILENGNSLKATIASSSGGETQTPFYVAVLASLYSVYNAQDDGLQLAIFDEAFDKMDNERIEECIQLLKSLGFQAIIVTPTDKISNLSKVADTTYIAASEERNGIRRSSVVKWQQRG